MPIFALDKVEEVSDELPIQLRKLVVDGRCQYDEFVEEIKSSNYLSEFNRGIALLEFSSNPKNPPLPKEKFRKLHLASDTVCYEVKTKHLRFYLCQYTDGRIILFCGYKNEQKSDLKKLDLLLNRLLQNAPQLF